MTTPPGPVSRRVVQLAAVAAVLLALSFWLFHTLIWDECCLDRDTNAQVENALIIGVPAVAGLAVAAVAVRAHRRR